MKFVEWQWMNQTRMSDGSPQRISNFRSTGNRQSAACDPFRYFVAPANDDLPPASLKEGREDDPLFWLDLVEVDGLVLLASRFDCGVEVFRSMRRDLGERGAQRTVNTVYLDELFDVNKFSDETLTAFASVVCECLRSRALREYPGRSFVAELMDAGVDGRFGIRLYEEKSQSPDN